MPRGRNPAIDATLTIAPAPAVSSIAGMAYFETRKMLSTLTCMSLAPDLRGFLHYAAGTGDADVVVEQVEATVGRDSRIDYCATLVLVGHVGGNRGGRAALVTNHLCRSFCQVKLPVGYQDTCSGACQQDSGRAAVADAVAGSTATRDDGDFACQPEIVNEF